MSEREAPLVILLRSASDPDPYIQALADAGWRAECRPVLAFSFPADTALRDHLRRADRYSGLVATSPRAARAVHRVFDDAGPLRAAWTGRPAYVVGPKTASRFDDLGVEVRGAETGDADRLAALIAEDAPDGRLLFLSGSRRRDTLPDGLRAAGVPFDELVVYETHLRSNLRLPPSEAVSWLVVFSPSGIEAIREAEAGPLSDYRCATIGPTTAEALRKAGVEGAAVAETPSPSGLVQALKQASGGPVP
ncbi:MAG: uroporphyrinogen-III synthase [Salinibacter sp.]